MKKPIEGQERLTAKEVRALPEGSRILLHIQVGPGEIQKEGILKKTGRFSAYMELKDYSSGKTIRTPVRDIEREYWTKA